MLVSHGGVQLIGVLDVALTVVETMSAVRAQMSVHLLRIVPLFNVYIKKVKSVETTAALVIVLFVVQVQMEQTHV